MVGNKKAEKLRAVAQRLVQDIEIKRRYRYANTPKRQRQESSDAIDANHLDRVRVAALKIAAAIEDGTLPDELAGLATKNELVVALRTRIDCSGGYYSIRDTGEFCDTRPEAVALRRWLDTQKTEYEKNAEAEREKIRTLEEKVKFADIPGFFPTPDEVIRRMCDRADLFSGCRVLEPSAGKGDVADYLHGLKMPGLSVECYELNYSLREILTAKGYALAAEPNFLAAEPDPVYDRVLMNPPFEVGQDAIHVRHAFKFLKPGGVLVSVTSPGPFDRSGGRYEAFREWFDEVGGEAEDLPPDSFARGFRQTGVASRLIRIARPSESE